MLDNNLPTTLQYQLKQLLLGRINKGDWPPGFRISSEREICDEYSVSRMTVREVLRDLVQDGYLVRKQGKGTFVSQPKVEQKLSSFYSFSEELKKMNLPRKTDVLSFDVVTPERSIRTQLGMTEYDRAFAIVRLRWVGNEPFAWEESFVPCNIAPGLSDDQVAELGLYNAIRSAGGVVPDEAEETFEAVKCPSYAAKHLTVRDGSPVLWLERFTSAAGMPVEFCRSIIRSDKYKYKVILK